MNDHMLTKLLVLRLVYQAGHLNLIVCFTEAFILAYFVYILELNLPSII
jgi:hypothetical protein